MYACCKLASHLLGSQRAHNPSPGCPVVLSRRSTPTESRKPRHTSTFGDEIRLDRKVKVKKEMSETRERADHRASASSSSSWFSLGPFPERVVSRHYVVDLDPPRSAIPRRVRARFDERSRKSARSSVDRSHARERRPRRGRGVREVRMRFVNSKRRLVLFRRYFFDATGGLTEKLGFVGGERVLGRRFVQKESMGRFGRAHLRRESARGDGEMARNS